jgi:hypothetical protein
MEAAQHADAAAFGQTQEGLALTGLNRTPFGQPLLAQRRQQGEAHAAMIPTELVQQYIQNALGQITGTQDDCEGLRRRGPHQRQHVQCQLASCRPRGRRVLQHDRRDGTG